MDTLTAELRTGKVKSGALRRAGKLPAVFYGKKQKAIPISVSAREFQKVWKRSGESSVVTLTTPEGDHEALIHDVDRDPITDAFRHVDFYVFEKGQKLRIKVPIEFTGTAPAVKEQGGVLVKVLHALEIEAAPKDLPHRIAVDVSPLVDFKSVVTAKMIALPTGVTLVTNPDEVVASVYEPKEEVVEAAPIDISQIEVEKKGKVLEEGAPAAGAEAPAAKAEAPVKEKEAKKKEAK